MNRALVLEPTAFGICAGWIENDRLVEVVFADDDPTAMTDRVFAARVRRVVPELNAAFVDCGELGDALITARDLRRIAGAEPGTPIGRLIQEGQGLIVQGRREAGGDKGARVSSDVHLPGVFLVHRPQGRDIDISRRVVGQERVRLFRRLRPALDESGWLVRRSAINASDDEILDDADALRAAWRALSDAAATDPTPRALTAPAEPVARVLRDSMAMPYARLIVGDPVLALRSEAFLDKLPQSRSVIMDRLAPAPGAFAQMGIDEQLEMALETDVALEGGGRIIIEKTAALTAIDVDGGARKPGLDLNIDAALEAARQIRLRNIGGTIVIDFVDMARKGERMKLTQIIRDALALDPLPVRLFPMSPIGLLQLSRPRRGPDLVTLMRRRCATCGGSGHGRSLRGSVQSLDGALAEHSGGRLELALATDVKQFVDGPGAAAFTNLQERHGVDLAVNVDDTLAPGGYRLTAIKRP